MGRSRRPRRRVSAGLPLQVGRPGLHAYLAARAGRRGRVPHQPLRRLLRRDHGLQPGEDRSQGPEDRPLVLEVNPAGFVIHSAIHAARHDAKCVLHTHTLNGVAVSAQRGGLLPISQHSMFSLGSLGYHDFEGPALNDDEKPRLVADLGNKTSLILRNHGLLTVGETVADAWVAMYYLEASCAIQVRAQAGGELIPVPKQVLEQAVSRTRQGPRVWPGLLRRLERLDPSYNN